MMNTHIGSLTSKREFLTFYYKNRWRLRFAFIIPFVLAVALSFVPTPRYKASSVLTVRMGAEYVYQPATGASANTQPTNVPFDHDQIFKSEVAILNSDDLHKSVIKQIGIENLYPELLAEKTNPIDKILQMTGLDSMFEGQQNQTGLSKEEALLSAATTKFEKRLDVELEKESSVITVTFEYPNAEMAEKVLTTMLDTYMEKRRALYLEPRVQTAKEHEKEARQRVVNAENTLETFKRTHNILGFDTEQAQLLSQRSDLQRQAASISSPALSEKLKEVEAQVAALNQDQAQLNALTHDASVAGDEYAVFAHQLSEATAYEDVEHERAGSVRVIQPPSVPAIPKNIQPLIIACGFILSLVSVAVIAVITDFFRSGFVTPLELSNETGMPVLVALPLKRKRNR